LPLNGSDARRLEFSYIELTYWAVSPTTSNADMPFFYQKQARLDEVRQRVLGVALFPRHALL